MAQHDEIDPKKQTPLIIGPTHSLPQDSKKKELSGPGENYPKGKFFNEKRILICARIGFTLLIGGLGAGIYWGWLSIPFSQKKSEVVASKTPLVGPTLKLPHLVINLREEDGQHYVKTTLVLEIGKQEWVEAVKIKTPLLIDLAILTLCDKRLQDLDKQNAKENLKKELLGKINQSSITGKIKQIYFDEFLYQ
jgi:flagellar basal body-associated protein FliL